MPTARHFSRRDQRGRLRRGLLLTPEHLTVWCGRKPRHLLWPEILRVRWLDREHAELVLVGGNTVPLGPIEPLDEAVAAIDQRVRPARAAAAAAYAVPSGLSRRFVLPRPVAWSQAVQCAVAFAVFAFVLSSLPPIHGHGPDFRAWRWWLAAASAVLGIRMLCTSRVGSGAVDATGVGTGNQRYAWQHIRRLVEVERITSGSESCGYDVHLETTDGLVKARVRTHADVSLLRRYLANREQWRTAGYVPAGPLPPPDTSLSRARETGHDATERGLSVTEGEGDH